MSKIFLCLLTLFCLIQSNGWSQSLREQFVQKAMNLSLEDSKKIENYFEVLNEIEQNPSKYMKKKEKKVGLAHPFEARSIILKILNKDPIFANKKIHVKLQTLDKSIRQIGGVKELAKRYLLWLNSSPEQTNTEQTNTEQTHTKKTNKKKIDNDFINALDSSFYQEAREDALYKKKRIRVYLYRAMYELQKWGNLKSDHPELTYEGFVPQDNESFVDATLPILFRYTQHKSFREKKNLVITTYSFMNSILKVLEENRTNQQFQAIYEMVQTILNNPQIEVLKVPEVLEVKK